MSHNCQSLNLTVSDTFLQALPEKNIDGTDGTVFGDTDKKLTSDNDCAE